MSKRTKKNIPNSTVQDTARSARSMRKIYGSRETSMRDILYNFSDILTVLLIILIAGLFITWRINALLNFESVSAASDDISTTEIADSSVTLTPSDEQTSENDNAGDSDQQAVPGEAAPEDNSNAEFTIEPGTGLSAVASDLFSLGLISDPDAFQSKVKEAGLENKINSGTYTIPFGSTIDEIIEILTV